MTDPRDIAARLTEAQRRKRDMRFRKVAGYYNPMAVCSACDHDASQVRFSYYCVDAIADMPFRCDECREQTDDR